MQKITINDKNFPKLLKKIPNPPKEIYVAGDLKEQKYPLAVVGTRKISDYGKQVTAHFTKELVQAGITIISGLALGVDGLAHKIALENNGQTIAVLGSGLNNIYPKIHQNLANKIIESNGAVISEYPPETPPYQSNFIKRNRLISGLSLGVLVIEAPEKSGALITAREAIKQKRKVFVVPGRIYDRNSQGANELIKNGAQLVSDPSDILKALKIKPVFVKNKNQENLSILEKNLLKILFARENHIDELSQKSGVKINEVISCLTNMEIKGLVKNLGNGKYIAIK